MFIFLLSVCQIGVHNIFKFLDTPSISVFDLATLLHMQKCFFNKKKKSHTQLYAKILIFCSTINFQSVHTIFWGAYREGTPSSSLSSPKVLNVPSNEKLYKAVALLPAIH
jgi:hypothetical protein